MTNSHRPVPAAALLAALALAAALPAQGGDERTLELQRTQRQLLQSRRESERLFDLRLRHDLGLPTDAADRVFVTGPPPASETVERLQQEWKDEEAATAALLERYTRLRADAEQLRAEAAARAAEQMPALTVPRAGTAVPAAGVVRAPVTPPAAPAGESRPGPALDPVTIEPALDPLRAQIHGSKDHRRVAQALFRAAQALADRAAAAREQGELVLATELDQRGAERARRALAELEPLLQAERPPFEALFCQGKCRELLFRHAERHDGLSLEASARDYQQREQQVRDPWLRITAADVRPGGVRGEAEVAGPWGRAAQAALEHFRWMNLHGGYDARATIEALTWPGAAPR